MRAPVPWTMISLSWKSLHWTFPVILFPVRQITAGCHVTSLAEVIMWCLFELCQPLFLLSKVNDLWIKTQNIDLLARDVKLCFNDGNPAAFLRLTLESRFSGMTFSVGAIKHAHVSGEMFFSVDCGERGAFLPSFGLEPWAPRPSTYFYLISVLTIVL